MRQGCEPAGGTTLLVHVRDGGTEAAEFKAWLGREVERRRGSAGRWDGAALTAVFGSGAEAAAAAFRDKAAYHGISVEVTPESKDRPRLSAREREVARLVADGLRNREIAARLFLSERTVENHDHRVLERTGLRSRAELAAWVARLSGELSVSPE